jgi:acetoin utilization deacetylase AcuC-like enzyme
MRVFHCDEIELPLPEGHRFPATKYRLLRESLLARGHIGPELLAPSPAASWESLARAHDSAYLDAIRDGALDAAAERRLGFPWSPALVERSRRSVGGTLAAAAWALGHGFAANLAGGTHHAFPDHGEGYCVFNDVGTAIRELQALHPGIRCAVIDLDVHQGNGTAAMFEGEPTVFTLSLHGRRNFPFRKQRSSLDVELEDGCDDATYLAALDAAMPRVLGFGPEFVFFIAGADVLATDALGLLDLTLEGIEARDARVLDACEAIGVPVVMVMGGGYSRPIEHTIEAHIRSFEALAARAKRRS